MSGGTSGKRNFMSGGGARFVFGVLVVREILVSERGWVCEGGEGERRVGVRGS